MTSTTSRCDDIIALIDACLTALRVANDDAHPENNESREHAR